MHRTSNRLSAALLTGILALGCATATKVPIPAVVAARPKALSEVERCAAVASSVVKVRVTRQGVDWNEPWKRTKPVTFETSGFLSSGREFVIAASEVVGATLVEVAPLGSTQWQVVDVGALDEVRALAAVHWPEDVPLSAKLKPLPVAKESFRSEGHLICHRVEDKLKPVKATFKKLTAENQGLSPSAVLTLQFEPERPVAGEGHLIVDPKGAMSGWMTKTTSSTVYALPPLTVAEFVSKPSTAATAALGKGGFRWQKLDSDNVRAHLGLVGIDGGVRVTHVSPNDSADGVLQPGDVVLSINKVAIGSSGTFAHPRYGKMPLDFMWSDGKKAGDALAVEFLRDGVRHNETLTLKHRTAHTTRAPAWVDPRKAEFAVIGGLVFVPLTQPFVKATESARLDAVYQRERLDDANDHGRVIVMSHVIPEPANFGFTQLVNLIVTRVNGVDVKDFSSLRQAFAAATGDFHVVEFRPGQTAQRVVLERKNVVLPQVDGALAQR